MSSGFSSRMEAQFDTATTQATRIFTGVCAALCDTTIADASAPKITAATTTFTERIISSPSLCNRAAEIGGDHARVLQHVARPPFGQAASIIEHMDAVGKIGHHLHVVLHPPHGDRHLLLDAHDE